MLIFLNDDGDTDLALFHKTNLIWYIAFTHLSFSVYNENAHIQLLDEKLEDFYYNETYQLFKITDKQKKIFNKNLIKLC